MSETNHGHPPEGTISTFVWEQTSSLSCIHFHIIANELSKSLEFQGRFSG